MEHFLFWLNVDYEINDDSNCICLFLLYDVNDRAIYSIKYAQKEYRGFLYHSLYRTEILVNLVCLPSAFNCDLITTACLSDVLMMLVDQTDARKQWYLSVTIDSCCTCCTSHIWMCDEINQQFDKEMMFAGMTECSRQVLQVIIRAHLAKCSPSPGWMSWTVIARGTCNHSLLLLWA